MNYFPFHIGDYASHTAHLEPMEDLAYRRLIDQYYLREGPLPLDIQATAKLIRMRSMAADVESVLREFFISTPEGWRHDRCDDEILAMKEKQQKQRDKANKRWAKPSPEPSNAANGNAALPRHNGNDAAAYTVALDSDAVAMPPTPTPTPTPTVNLKALAPSCSGTEQPAEQKKTEQFALLATEPPPNIFITLPATQGEQVPITERQVIELQELYPATNVEQELRGMRGWLIGNPKNAKTSRGMMAFVTSWLARVQNKSGQMPPRINGNFRPTTAERNSAFMDALTGRNQPQEQRHERDITGIATRIA